MEVKNWKDADAWIVSANNGLDEQIDEKPFWYWGPGFKLNYDGNIISISSRFYPPESKHLSLSVHFESSGETEWTGNVTIYCSINEHYEIKKAFSCKALDDLKLEVESYVHTMNEKFNVFFKQLQNDFKKEEAKNEKGESK